MWDFIVFDEDGSDKVVKKMVGYHQSPKVGTAVEDTLRVADLQVVADRSATMAHFPAAIDTVMLKTASHRARLSHQQGKRAQCWAELKV